MQALKSSLLVKSTHSEARLALLVACPRCLRPSGRGCVEMVGRSGRRFSVAIYPHLERLLASEVTL